MNAAVTCWRDSVESGEFADRPVLLAAIAVQGYEIP
jgi:hypothetical protein